MNNKIFEILIYFLWNYKGMFYKLLNWSEKIFFLWIKFNILNSEISCIFWQHRVQSLSLSLFRSLWPNSSLSQLTVFARFETKEPVDELRVWKSCSIITLSYCNRSTPTTTTIYSQIQMPPSSPFVFKPSKKKESK